MATIHANGRMTGSITVGNYSGMNRSELEELLSTKADVEHTHDYNELSNLPEIPSIEGLASEEYVNNQIGKIPEIDLSDYVNNDQLMEGLNSKAEKEHKHEEYLTQHQDISHLALKTEIPSIEGLATITYVDNAIDAIPEVDLSNCATKEELNEVKSSVSNGKVLLASAITDKGVETLATDSFETMADNIREITTSEEPIENPYYIEYRVEASDYALNGGTAEYKYGIPRIYSDTSTYSYTYDKVEIELNDGTITDDLNTKTKDVYKIRLWYPESTVALKFYSSSTYVPLVNIVDYIKTDNFTDTSFMFYCCSNLVYIDKKNVFNTSNVTDMLCMFSNCSKLTSLDLSNFNTSKVTSMGNMFNNCTSLTSLDLSNFDTSNVTNMSNMFQNCLKLTSIDLSNFDTSNVTVMYNMFNNCSKLTSLDLSNFDTSNVTNMGNMFNKVPSTVDWHYDGTNYQNFTLTESRTNFSGKFPWNQ